MPQGIEAEFTRVSKIQPCSTKLISKIHSRFWSCTFFCRGCWRFLLEESMIDFCFFRPLLLVDRTETSSDPRKTLDALWHLRISWQGYLFQQCTAKLLGPQILWQTLMVMVAPSVAMVESSTREDSKKALKQRTPQISLTNRQYGHCWVPGSALRNCRQLLAHQIALQYKAGWIVWRTERMTLTGLHAYKLHVIAHRRYPCAPPYCHEGSPAYAEGPSQSRGLHYRRWVHN